MRSCCHWPGRLKVEPRRTVETGRPVRGSRVLGKMISCGQLDPRAIRFDPRGDQQLVDELRPADVMPKVDFGPVVTPDSNSLAPFSGVGFAANAAMEFHLVASVSARQLPGSIWALESLIPSTLLARCIPPGGQDRQDRRESNEQGCGANH